MFNGEVRPVVFRLGKLGVAQNISVSLISLEECSTKIKMFFGTVFPPALLLTQSSEMSRAQIRPVVSCLWRLGVA